MTITWKRGHRNDLLGNIHKQKNLTYFWYFWRHTEHVGFNDKQINPLQSSLQTAQLPGSDSGASVLSQLNKSGCFRSSYKPQETCVCNKSQNKPRAPDKPQASQTVKRNILSWPFLGIEIGKHCRKVSAQFWIKKPLTRAESGPGTSTDQNHTEWHWSRCLIAASENPARLCHKISNIRSASEPLGTASCFGLSIREEKRRAWRGQSLHHVLAWRWTHRTSARDTHTRAGYSAAPEGPTCGSWGWGSQAKLHPCARNKRCASRTEARDGSYWDWRGLSPHSPRTRR